MVERPVHRLAFCELPVFGSQELIQTDASQSIYYFSELLCTLNLTAACLLFNGNMRNRTI